MQRERRRRKITQPYSAFGCQTCRIRKVRCDQQRPLCKKCLNVGRDCHYDRENVQLAASVQVEDVASSASSRQVGSLWSSEARPPLQILRRTNVDSDYASSRQFTSERAPSPRWSIDNWAHVQIQIRDHFIEDCRPNHNRMDECFTSVLTVADVSPRPLALTTTALALLHAESIQPGGNQQLVYEASKVYGKAIGHLRRALTSVIQQDQVLGQGAFTILLSLLLIGCYVEPESFFLKADPLPRQWEQHQFATARYLQAVGPKAFDLTNVSQAATVNSVMITNFKISLAFRRTMILKEDISRFLNATTAKTLRMPVDFLQWYRIIFPLPGLLGRADAMSNADDAAEDSECVELVQRLFQLQQELERHIKSFLGPIIILTAPTSLDPGTEEHRFLSGSSTFPSQYRFPTPLSGIIWISTWLSCLLADCAALRIIHWRLGSGEMSDPAFSDVERAAIQSATELCRCIHFLSERDSTIYLHTTTTVLRVAATFFDEVGATEESIWCWGCHSAAQHRSDRLSPSRSRPLCRVGNVSSALAAAVQYRSKSRVCPDDLIE